MTSNRSDEQQQDPRTSGRPAPRYGEYAPDGWAPAPEQAADVEHGEAPSAPGNGRDADPIPGVPHNLGVSGQPGRDEPVTAASNRQYSAPAPDASAPSPAPGSPAPAPPGSQRGNGRAVDRVVTIMLLAFGALGALYFAATLQQLPASLGTFAHILDSDGVAIPDVVTTIGTVGAITVLALYALNLIFSIQRLRARKITFWVPLAAGVIATIIVFAFTAFAMNQVPEVTQMFTDPDALNKILDYLSEPRV